MKKQLLKLSTAAMVLVLPLFAHAQLQGSGPGLRDWMVLITKVLKWAFPVLITIVVLILLLRVVQYISSKNAGSKEETKTLMKKITTTIFALFVVLAIWGIMAFISSTLGIGVGYELPAEGVPSVQGLDDVPSL